MTRSVWMTRNVTSVDSAAPGDMVLVFDADRNSDLITSAYLCTLAHSNMPATSRFLRLPWNASSWHDIHAAIHPLSPEEVKATPRKCRCLRRPSSCDFEAVRMSSERCTDADLFADVCAFIPTQ